MSHFENRRALPFKSRHHREYKQQGTEYLMRSPPAKTSSAFFDKIQSVSGFFFIFAMRLRLYFNSFHVIHLILQRGPHPLTLFHIYRMFHSLPDVLKIYQIQFDRSLVNIAFSADSLPFEPINFQFQLSSLEGNHLYLLLNCAHKTKHFLTTIDNF